jgi:hypothetical protein
MTKLFSDQWVQEWCQENGWTDLFVERYSYWAFPPGAVMPQPIPVAALRRIKATKGWSPAEQYWYGGAIALATLTVGLSYYSHCPLPLVLAFAFAALVTAHLDDGEMFMCS